MDPLMVDQLLLNLVRLGTEAALKELFGRMHPVHVEGELLFRDERFGACAAEENVLWIHPVTITL